MLCLRKKIGFMDGYKSIPETNESVCMQCDGLLSPFSDRIWRSEDADEIDTVKAEAAAFIESKGQDLQNPDKLQKYLEAKVTERMDFLKDKMVREEVAASISDQPVAEPPEPDYDELCSQLLLTTAGTLEGYHITKQLGVVFGETVFKPSAGQQISFFE